MLSLCVKRQCEVDAYLGVAFVIWCNVSSRLLTLWPDTFAPKTLTPETFTPAVYLNHVANNFEITCATRRLLHHIPFTSEASRSLLHQHMFSSNTFIQQDLLHRTNAKQSYVKLYTPEDFWTRNLLHQKTFHTKQLYHKTDCKQILEQTFTLEAFYARCHGQIYTKQLQPEH